MKGFFELFCHIDGQIACLRAIKDINLKWLFFIATDNKVICIALQQFWLRVWQSDNGSLTASEILNAIRLFIDQATCTATIFLLELN